MRRSRLNNLTPHSFLEQFSPAVGVELISRGTTSGELALRDDIPTLDDVAAIIGKRTAIDWLKVQLYKLEEAGAMCLTQDGNEHYRIMSETAAMILAKHKLLNLAELSLFFARYMTGEYREACKGNSGAMCIYVALDAYMDCRNADVRRIEREQQMREFLDRWAESNARACSYDEYRQGVEHLNR